MNVQKITKTFNFFNYYSGAALRNRTINPTLKYNLGLFFLVILDMFTIAGLFLLSISIRLKVLPYILSDLPVFRHEFTNYYWILPVWFLILIYEGAYTKRFNFWDELKLIVKISILATLVVFTVASIGKLNASISRFVLLFMLPLSITIFPAIRMLHKKLLFNIGLLKSKILIIGAGDTGKLALSALRKDTNLGYEVVGFIDEDKSLRGSYIDGVKVHNGFKKVEKYLRNCDILEVIIAIPSLNKKKLAKLVGKLQHKVRRVILIPDLFGMAVLNTEVRHFFSEQTLALEIKNNLSRPIDRFMKQAIDYFIAIILSVVLLIPITIIALMIRLTSKGKIIFKHKRSGKNGKPFYCYKFRTMSADAEERLKEILENDPLARAEWDEQQKLTKDPRVFRIGNFLRVTSLDELPQIFNVLKGEMSLVGPRPVTAEELKKQYKEDANLCFSVPPGITGLWQVSGRSNTSYKYRISMDSWYVRNWNIWLDLVILLKTVKVVFRKEGAS